MQNLKNVFVLSFLFSCIAFTSVGQKKYIKRNRKAPFISYGDSLTYSRGFYNDSIRMFIGNSNGRIYYFNLRKEKSQLIFNMPNVNEIRDIEKSGDHLVAMHSGEDGKLFIIKLNGEVRSIAPPEWKGVFLDGLDIKDNTGFLMGDPVDSLFSLFHSNDGGLTWERIKNSPKAYKGEAGFAASGTNVQVLNDSTYVFVSGGLRSRFFKTTDKGNSWYNIDLPYYPGESIGPYSLCFANDSIGVMVGGDYKDAALGMNSCFYTFDGGESWYNAMETVGGYRSCVYYVDGVFYAAGTNGIDFSTDNGKEWTPFAEGNFFTLSSVNGQLLATTTKGRFQLFDLIETK